MIDSLRELRHRITDLDSDDEIGAMTRGELEAYAKTTTEAFCSLAEMYVRDVEKFSISPLTH